MVKRKNDRDALAALRSRLGSEEAVDDWLRDLGLRVFVAARLPTLDSPKSTSADEGVDTHPDARVIRRVLRRHGLRALEIRRGRPSVAMLVTFEDELEVAGSEETSAAPLVFDAHTARVIAVSVARTRTSGSAAFTIAPPARTKKVWDAMLFVLLAERRAWLVTRDELAAHHRTIRHGGEKTFFGYDTERKLLRVRFPRSVTGYDLRERLV